ncbi:hypothetical protein [Actinoplanes utahensis]|uniref:hypothetical protein n=1 Tax=Actinoplanes utahensis TaxID=1869 RepID=UPI001A45282D|nr:hypothetical protein [Actinoplanes utahensis]GIF30335.1 hypothetical protein Aut01nite_33210 [Actinoplanes utahensis]
MHLDTILTLIGERETTAATTAGRLREQIALLSTELTRIDRELADLATTRTMLQHLAATEFTADDPTIVSSGYQQILAILSAATGGMRQGRLPRPGHRTTTETRRRNPSQAETPGQSRDRDRGTARNRRPDPETDLTSRNVLSGLSQWP